MTGETPKGHHGEGAASRRTSAKANSRARSAQRDGLATLAAAYVRMSTEHQQYSTSNQMEVIREYARRRGLEIVKVYSDEGKSGLNIQGRDSLGQMIRDVQSGQAQFGCILVYDVSRWGRFQDADESAYYEYICRQAGVLVHYCAEQFENDGSPVSTIVKGVKRAMAGEYSRELSSKVFQGACRLIQLGYKQGGTAGFGLRRMLIDQAGTKKGELKMGEQKSIQTDRVVLVRGPEAEVATVRWIYQAFVNEGKTEAEIAAQLNTRGIRTDYDRAWTRSTVHQVLTNEKYIGNNVYHRTSFKLKRKHVVNPPERWIRADGVFEGIVEPGLFAAAQQIILARSQRLSDEEMLERLRGLLQQAGGISGMLIDETEGMPSSAAFRHRFGSLVRAYTLIGYDPGIDYTFIEENRRLRRQHPELMADVMQRIDEIGGIAQWDRATDLLRLSGELAVSIVLCRHTATTGGASRWVIRLDAGLKPDITVAARMDATNEGIRDYYLLPGMDMTWENLRMAECNGIYLDAYRYETLDYLVGMTERRRIQETSE
jgi:DNA invertase Pin-like site-specific DNA recombinase